VTTFTAELPATRPLDPSKRVRYTAGLVLGVDEFTQEQTYHVARDRLHNRLLHGYGTASGLKVTVRTTGQGPEVVVSAGAAVDPRGQIVCVRSAQCARLNAWLQANADDVAHAATLSPASVSVYVVLKYRECEADWVPVPGGPCRMQDDTRMPSRLLDAFELTLTLRRPDQFEEDASRELGRLLASIEISDSGGSYSTDEDVAAAVRGVQAPVMSPPHAALRFKTTTADERMRTLYRIWTTEARPSIVPGSEGGCEGPHEEWLQLARLTFTLTASQQVDGTVTVDESERPILVPARVLHGAR
jgi:hypothetical protein